MSLKSNNKSSRKAKSLPQFSIPSGHKPLLDLLEIQRKSFFDLLEQGIPHELAKTDTFQETAKNSNFTQKLELVLNPETYKFISPNFTPKQAILKGKTYACKIYVQATLRIQSSARTQDSNPNSSGFAPSNPSNLLNHRLIPDVYAKWVSKSFVNDIDLFRNQRTLYPKGYIPQLRKPPAYPYRTIKDGTVALDSAEQQSLVSNFPLSRRSHTFLDKDILQVTGEKFFPFDYYPPASRQWWGKRKPTPFIIFPNCTFGVAKLRLRADVVKGSSGFKGVSMQGNFIVNPFFLNLISISCRMIPIQEARSSQEITQKLNGHVFSPVLTPRFASIHTIFNGKVAQLRKPGQLLPLAQPIPSVPLPEGLTELGSGYPKKMVWSVSSASFYLQSTEKPLTLALQPLCFLGYGNKLKRTYRLFGREKSPLTLPIIPLKSSSTIQEYEHGGIDAYPYPNSVSPSGTEGMGKGIAGMVQDTQSSLPISDTTEGSGIPEGSGYVRSKELTNKVAKWTNVEDKGVQIFYPWIFLGELPLMTKRGHFILNGSPRVIVNQIARCPGIYFQEKRRGVGFEQEVRVSADLIPQRGPWLRIQSDWEGRFWARLKQEGRVKYATLYEAFLEFEKQYKAPLVSLLATNSSPFSKSEIIAFQERKTKEDRQKKALMRLFKNSTRYSLGKIGRFRVNQRVHCNSLHESIRLEHKVHNSVDTSVYSTNKSLNLIDKSSTLHPFFFDALGKLITRTTIPSNLAKRNANTRFHSNHTLLPAAYFVPQANIPLPIPEGSGYGSVCPDLLFNKSPQHIPNGYAFTYPEGQKGRSWGYGAMPLHTQRVSKVEVGGLTDPSTTAGMLRGMGIQNGVNSVRPSFQPYTFWGLAGKIVNSFGEFNQQTLEKKTQFDIGCNANIHTIFFRYPDPNSVSPSGKGTEGMGKPGLRSWPGKVAEGSVSQKGTLVNTNETGFKNQKNRLFRFLDLLEIEKWLRSFDLIPTFSDLSNNIPNNGNSFIKQRSFRQRTKKHYPLTPPLTNSNNFFFTVNDNLSLADVFVNKPSYLPNSVSPYIPGLPFGYAKKMVRYPYPSGMGKDMAYLPFGYVEDKQIERMKHVESFSNARKDGAIQTTLKIGQIKNLQNFVTTYKPFWVFLSLPKLIPLRKRIEVLGRKKRKDKTALSPSGILGFLPFKKLPSLKKHAFIFRPLQYFDSFYGQKYRLGAEKKVPLSVFSSAYKPLPGEAKKMVWSVSPQHTQRAYEVGKPSAYQYSKLLTPNSEGNMLSQEYTKQKSGLTDPYPDPSGMGMGTGQATAGMLGLLQSKKLRVSEVEGVQDSLAGDNNWTTENSIDFFSQSRNSIEITPQAPEQFLLMAEDIDAIHACLEHLLEGQGVTDDIDHLKNRFIRTSGKLLQQQFELGLYRLNEVIAPLLVNLLQGQLALLKNLSTELPDSSLSPSQFGMMRNNKRIAKSTNLLDTKKGRALPIIPDRTVAEGGVQSWGLTDPYPYPKGKGKGTGQATAGMLRGDEVKDQHINKKRASRTKLAESQAKKQRQGTSVPFLQPQNAGIITPFRWLRTSKPINGAFREFFGSNPLSQYMDQTNPLAEITHKRRLSSMGPGGIKRETAGMEVRGIHPTHYGRVCPIETPEGKNAGLVNSPTVYSRIGKDGFLETPLYQAIENQIQMKRWAFFSAQQEEEEQSSLATCDIGLMRFQLLPNAPIPVQTANNPLAHFQQVERHRVGYRALSPVQTISIATALIPFLEHDDANRALMGSNMQRQAIPLLIPERPIVGTGFEPFVVVESGQALQATQLGCVSRVSANSITVHNLQFKGEALSQKVLRNTLDNQVLHYGPAQPTYLPIHTPLFIPQHTCDSPSSKAWPTSSFGTAHTFGTLTRRAYGVGVRVPKKDGMVSKKEVGCEYGGGIGNIKKEEGAVRGSPVFFGTKPMKLEQHNEVLHISKKIPRQTATKLNLCSSFNTFLLAPNEQRLQLYQRSNQETCLTQRPLVQEGDWVQKGDFLADCSASKSGDLALGKNVTVAYMPWEGYNFEDAIVISDRLVCDDVYTSLHIERYEIKVNKNSQGKEQITNRIPGTSHSLKHLDNFGIARISSWVQPGDILVGKVVELKRPLSPYERLAWELASRLSPTSPEREKWLNKVWLEDISLRLPPGVCGRVINSQLVSTEWSEKEQVAYPVEVHIYLAVKRKIQVGDKLAGRHGNKGIVSTILPQQDMPYLGNGRSIDMVLNPLGVPSRMNLGQIFECLLGLAGSQLGCNFKITPFDEIAGGEASRSLVFLKLYQCRLLYKQQWLFTPTFPGKSKLFDGRTGEPFENWVTVGQAYMLKLIHMVDHKIHARSTGPYSLFTRQPVRGRSRRGGQRLGEMEVWAVEGFGAAYTLQEFLTIKSDDLKARTALQRSFYKQNDVTFGNIHIAPGNPEAFKVLVSELKALCLHIQM